VLRFRPFCSAGCRGRDLLAWLDGSYAVPAVDAEDDAVAEDAPAPPPEPPTRR
jgi:endogenous inhibitor of DNA gyrase (YacG/DUF329 family)